MTRSRQTADWGSRAGLAKIVPSSVAVGSGTGSASALGTVTFSGCSSVSLNDVFSSTYTNYRIAINLTSAAASQVLMRMRVSGADNTTSNYTAALYYLRSNISQANGAGFTGPANSFAIATDGNVTSYESIIEIFEPFETQVTKATQLGFYSGYSPRQDYGIFGGIVFDGTTSFTGFTLLSNSTITGTVSVYGYN
jgi:hypothetical protein